MDVTQALAASVDRLSAALPPELAAIVKQEFDGLAAVLADAEAAEDRIVDKLVAKLTATAETLMGAPDLLSVGRALSAALVIGKQLELYAPAGPFIMRLGDAPK